VAAVSISRPQKAGVWPLITLRRPLVLDAAFGTSGTFLRRWTVMANVTPLDARVIEEGYVPTDASQSVQVPPGWTASDVRTGTKRFYLRRLSRRKPDRAGVHPPIASAPHPTCINLCLMVHHPKVSIGLCPGTGPASGLPHGQLIGRPSRQSGRPWLARTRRGRPSPTPRFTGLSGSLRAERVRIPQIGS